MKVTMYNPTTRVVVKGVNVKFIPKWINLGFEVKSYDSDKVVVLKAG